MRRFIFLACAFLCCLTLRAQEKDMMWVNVTALHYVVTGGTDKGHTLQQYLLFDEAVAEENEGVFDHFGIFGKEFNAMALNRSIPEGLKEIDESVAEIRRMIEEYPELAETLKEALKGAEAARKELAENEDPSVTSYTYDPAVLLRKLTSISVNHKAYTAWRDIGRGLYSVTEGPRFGPVDEDSFNPARFEEGAEYSWGAIDYEGHSVLAPKYYKFWTFEDEDIIFLTAKEKDGSIHSGARGYDGRVRIPFVYDDIIDVFVIPYNIACFSQNGKYGFVSFDGNVLWPFEFSYVEHIGSGWYVSKDGKNYGVVDYKGQLGVPLKYRGMWDEAGGELKMMRQDGKLDVYDNSKDFDYRFLRIDPVPEM